MLHGYYLSLLSAVPFNNDFTPSFIFLHVFFVLIAVRPSFHSAIVLIPSCYSCCILFLFAGKILGVGACLLICIGQQL
jgi:hypothetical protein